MKSENIIQTKSYAFAIKIVNTYKQLKNEEREFILSKQLLRAGTSIGANVEEAIGGQTKKDFFAKISISYKEARETKFWLRLLRDTDYLNENVSEKLIADVDELLKILGSIQKTIRNS